ncbi:MAG: hypothetical protein AMXMBFR37_17950 [Steroidobacteraceae bacterium]|jgi:hypothetical protein|nr:DUF1761 domain-containing protein [Steroidobacteraceae bacterium]
MDINWLAVVVAAVAAFLVGALWYSPLLFAKAWQREIGISDTDLARGNMARILGSAFVLWLLATVVFHMFLGASPGAKFGAGAGFAAGLFWVAFGKGIDYLFERRSLRLFLINGGHSTVAFTVMGLVLGLMGGSAPQ